MYCGLHKYIAAQLFSTLIMIRNVSSYSDFWRIMWHWRLE